MIALMEDIEKYLNNNFLRKFSLIINLKWEKILLENFDRNQIHKSIFILKKIPIFIESVKQ